MPCDMFGKASSMHGSMLNVFFIVTLPTLKFTETGWHLHIHCHLPDGTVRSGTINF